MCVRERNFVGAKVFSVWFFVSVLDNVKKCNWREKKWREERRRGLSRLCGRKESDWLNWSKSLEKKRVFWGNVGGGRNCRRFESPHARIVLAQNRFFTLFLFSLHQSVETMAMEFSSKTKDFLKMEEILFFIEIFWYFIFVFLLR